MNSLYDNSQQLLVLSIIAIYFCGLMYLGYHGFKKTKTFSDYILGGRKLGPTVAAMNVGASDMSSWLLMGLPGAFYLYGMNQIWMAIGLVSGSYLSWKFVAVRLRKYSEVANDSLTLSSFLENRFQDKSRILNITTALAILFFFTVYIASGFVGGAKIFSETFDLSYHYALTAALFIIVSYALLGGFLAVSWADLFQGLLMLFVLVITPIFVFFGDTNPVGLNLFNELKEISPDYLNPFHDMTFVGIIGLLSWGLGYFGQPHIIVKYMAIKDPKKIARARRTCISWAITAIISAAAVGILGGAIFMNDPLAEHETVFIVLAMKAFHPMIIGVLIAAILSAIMSTINSQIIICSSVLGEDFYRRFFRKKAEDKEMLLISRAFVVLTALVAFYIAFDENSTVLGLVAKAWAGLGASIGPVILFSLFWKRTTRNGAIAGVVSGMVGALVFAELPYFSYEILPAFLLSAVMIFVVSIITSHESIKEMVEEHFRSVDTVR